MTSGGSPVRDTRGAVDAAGLRVGILVASFNSEITDRLLEGALAALGEHGARDRDIEVVRVPGAWELPQSAHWAVASGRFDALVALGCVIRGGTPHFEYVCSEATRGLGAVARDSKVPVAFGVLTTDDRAQALARAGEGPDNKGFEAAMAALEMVRVRDSLGAG